MEMIRGNISAANGRSPGRCDTKGSARTSGWACSALPVGEVRALPGGAGRNRMVD